MPELEALRDDVAVLNAGCRDVSKRHISRVFEEVFGYAIALDPSAHTGPAVEKSDGNATHDGRIVQCPIAVPKQGSAYQIFVDSQRGGMVEEIRTPVMGGVVPFVYLKRKPPDARFRGGRYAAEARMFATLDLVSAEEVENVVAFCARLRMDYGELDMLRDRDSGRLYIVDANPTPWGPPRATARKDVEPALRRLAEAFDQQLSRLLA